MVRAMIVRIRRWMKRGCGRVLVLCVLSSLCRCKNGMRSWSVVFLWDGVWGRNLGGVRWRWGGGKWSARPLNHHHVEMRFVE